MFTETFAGYKVIREVLLGINGSGAWLWLVFFAFQGFPPTFHHSMLPYLGIFYARSAFNTSWDRNNNFFSMMNGNYVAYACVCSVRMSFITAAVWPDWNVATFNEATDDLELFVCSAAYPTRIRGKWPPLASSSGGIRRNAWTAERMRTPRQGGTEATCVNHA